MAALYDQTHKPVSVHILENNPIDDILGFASIPAKYNRFHRIVKGTCDYMLYLADDIALEPEYAERCLKRMAMTPNCVVASGDMLPYDNVAPHGAARFIQSKWFWENYPNGTPNRIGAESEILDRAMMQKKYIWCWNDIRFVHLQELGAHGSFKEFGKARKALGWYAPYVILHALLSASNANIGIRGALSIVWNYFVFFPDIDGYYSLWDAETRAFVRRNTRRNFYGYFFANLLANPINKCLRWVMRRLDLETRFEQ